MGELALVSLDCICEPVASSLFWVNTVTSDAVLIGSKSVGVYFYLILYVTSIEELICTDYSNVYLKKDA